MSTKPRRKLAVLLEIKTYAAQAGYENLEALADDMNMEKLRVRNLYRLTNHGISYGSALNAVRFLNKKLTRNGFPKIHFSEIVLKENNIT